MHKNRCSKPFQRLCFAATFVKKAHIIRVKSVVTVIAALKMNLCEAFEFGGGVCRRARSRLSFALKQHKRHKSRITRNQRAFVILGVCQMSVKKFKVFLRKINRFLRQSLHLKGVEYFTLLLAGKRRENEFEKDRRPIGWRCGRQRLTQTLRCVYGDFCCVAQEAKRPPVQRTVERQTGSGFGRVEQSTQVAMHDAFNKQFFDV